MTTLASMGYDKETTHIGFADEAYWNQGQFRSVSLVSMDVSNYEQNLHAIAAARILDKELKWHEVKGYERQMDANSVITKIVSLAAIEDLRVDVLIWDIDDDRHNTIGRDDKQNLEHMYRFLIYDVLHNRWESMSQWDLCIDKKDDLDCVFLQRGILNRIGCLVPIKLVASNDFTLVQVADLFAGIGAYSYIRYPQFSTWIEHQSRQLTLMNECEPEEDRSSKSDKFRFSVMRHLKEQCSNFGMSLSLSDRKRGFCSMNPNAGHKINFWRYVPQGDYDKAPTRNRT